MHLRCVRRPSSEFGFRSLIPVDVIAVGPIISRPMRVQVFVKLLCRDHAQKAIERLNGYGYDNLILHVEWAQPRAER